MCRGNVASVYKDWILEMLGEACWLLSSLGASKGGGRREEGCLIMEIVKRGMLLLTEQNFKHQRLYRRIVTFVLQGQTGSRNVM